MLETKNLKKVYKPKRGVPVTALDDVSLKFPDTGMVFLLGKSGSGKSTLLNLLGGLDKYDGGEIIIKGVSSKTFKQKHFDSYRNTYVGFIFQEYNVLDEFSVGANIALALELQGKKATDEDINRILCEVDLDGYGNRRPNELSGGQKQRIAIARALVKSPKIIMADEPTGALDSVTGEQIFDTLKKLSKSKLVIVVSHDRDFASRYADRIIELADGKVISDTMSSREEAVEESTGIVFQDATATVPYGYHLTEEDRIAINQYIDNLKKGVKLEFSIKKTGSMHSFVPTDSAKIQHADKSEFKLIKSKLSLKHAFKIGAAGLKYKKFRLVMTVLLSCIAFALFGLADTFGSYNHIETCVKSIYDTQITYASLVKSVRNGTGINENWNSWGTSILKDDIEEISKNTGISLKGVLQKLPDAELYFEQYVDYRNVGNTDYPIYATSFSGIVEISESDMTELGYQLVAGKLPDGGKNEIAISTYVCETFKQGGYRDIYSVNDTEGNEYQEIEDYSDMVGKTFTFNEQVYTVTSVIDTLLDWDRYEVLKETESSEAGALVNYVLYNEFEYETDYNYTGMMMVGEGGMDRIMKDMPRTADVSNSGYIMFHDADSGQMVDGSYFAKLENMNSSLITWIDGEKSTLGEKEIVISSHMAEWYLGYMPGQEEMTSVTLESLGEMDFQADIYNYSEGTAIQESGYKIVGILDTHNSKYAFQNGVVLPDVLYDKYAASSEGDYDFLLGVMPADKEGIDKVVSYCYSEEDDVRYELNNPVCYELDTVNEILKVLSKVFLYIGLGFCLFAAILLSNFIATSISYKKQEIGILRAIGSRSNDVFRIFFSESFIIAMINFVLATGVSYAATMVINNVLRADVGILITILNFGVRQAALILGVSILVAFVASYLPVKRIASKRPIDAIRNR